MWDNTHYHILWILSMWNNTHFHTPTKAPPTLRNGLLKFESKTFSFSKVLIQYSKIITIKSLNWWLKAYTLAHQSPIAPPPKKKKRKMEKNPKNYKSTLHDDWNREEIKCNDYGGKNFCHWLGQLLNLSSPNSIIAHVGQSWSAIKVKIDHNSQWSLFTWLEYVSTFS